MLKSFGLFFDHLPLWHFLPMILKLTKSWTYTLLHVNVVCDTKFNLFEERNQFFAKLEKRISQMSSDLINQPVHPAQCTKLKTCVPFENFEGWPMISNSKCAVRQRHNYIYRVFEISRRPSGFKLANMVHFT